jgi:cell division protein FtsI (penicillin-binding protein 3)/stage V sporulation protein D (sporulation-specific penicillin-binding protein)
MMSQALGFLGGSGAGQYGVEGYYEDSLKGQSVIMQDQSGLNSIFSSADQISRNGSDVYLTIDYNIQFQAEQLLKKEKEKDDIDGGQIIVMKPDTGRILALAGYPNFDPNQYGKEKNMAVFQNGFVQKLFEPGSIMKAFTMAVALNEGKITPNTTYTDTGVVSFSKDSIHNFANEKFGVQTMTQVLENSINTGAVYAEQQVSHKTFFEYFDKFGFFRKTGMDLQGEVSSKNEALRKGGDVEYATASFGQGVELTPMQIARAYCMLANGGKLVKPYIVDKIVSGKSERSTKSEISQPVISQSTLSELNTMLINVVDKGFNGVAKIPGYYFGGKTGTAQIPLANGKGYMPDNNTIQSFVGYGPVFNPQFLIMVKLDNPKVPKSALSAVPIYKQLAQYIINYWQIPPDYDISAKK